METIDAAASAACQAQIPRLGTARPKQASGPSGAGSGMPEAPKSNLEHRKARERLDLSVPQPRVKGEPDPHGAGVSVLRHVASLAGPCPLRSICDTTRLFPGNRPRASWCFGPVRTGGHSSSISHSPVFRAQSAGASGIRDTRAEPLQLMLGETPQTPAPPAFLAALRTPFPNPYARVLGCDLVAPEQWGNK